MNWLSSENDSNGHYIVPLRRNDMTVHELYGEIGAGGCFAGEIVRDNHGSEPSCLVSPAECRHYLEIR